MHCLKVKMSRVKVTRLRKPTWLLLTHAATAVTSVGHTIAGFPLLLLTLIKTTVVARLI